MLFSGGIHELVGLLAADLGIDRFRGMSLERSDGVFTGEVALSAGLPKHEVAVVLAGGRAIRWSESIAVGDALPDAALLERVGHPCAFEPTPALARRARDGGWTVTGRDTLRPLVRTRLGLGAAGAPLVVLDGAGRPTPVEAATSGAVLVTNHEIHLLADDAHASREATPCARGDRRPS
jgi:hypothetical protein